MGLVNCSSLYQFERWAVYNHQSVVGRLLQKTARAEPPRAIRTTLTAAGTHTMTSEKCFCANAKPKAALCMPARHQHTTPSVWTGVRTWSGLAMLDGVL